MFFFVFPTGTDAPCYHPPFATFGLILLNVIVLIIQFVFPEFTETFKLSHGSFNPLTWFTSVVMHAGIFHLLGNMVVLAIVGWIIEGKVGWWQFILIYFAIAVASCGVEQLVMLPFGGNGSLGASGVVYGMIAIALIWAPENEITIFWFALVLLFPVFGTIEVSVLGVCFFLIAIEFLTSAFTGFGMSSALLHLMGVVPGAIIGFEMVRRRWVDCEGYDLLSIQRGERGKRVLTVQQERELEREKEERKAAAVDELKQSKIKIQNYLDNGHFELALNRYQMMRRKVHGFRITEPQMVALVNGLWNLPEKRPKAAEVMEDYLQQYHQLRVPITLKLARYQLLDRERPKKCLLLIKGISDATMDEAQTKLATQLVAKAQQMIQDGVMDFADD